MKELLRTTDPSILNIVEALLSETAIHHFVADRNISIVEGSIGLFPRRVLVVDEEFDEARRVLEEAGLAGELRRP